MTVKRVWTIAALLFVAIVLLLAVMLFIFQSSTPGGMSTKNTVGAQKEWMQNRMLRELRSIAAEDGGVRVVAVERPILYKTAADQKNLWDFRRGDSVRLAVGDSMHDVDNHGGNAFTIRKVLPDRVVVDYESLHCMNGCSADTGTIELKYRSSTPLHTENAHRDAIARLFDKQFKYLQQGADGKSVEVTTATSQKFFVRSSEVSHRIDHKAADTALLRVGEGIMLPSPGKGTVVEIRDILPAKVVFQYRTAFNYRGMQGMDKGLLELAYRK